MIAVRLLTDASPNTSDARRDSTAHGISRAFALRGLRGLRDGQGARPLQGCLQVASGVRGLVRGDLFGRADRNDAAPAVSALRPEIDDPIGGLDDVEIVLDHDHRIALVAQPMQDR